VAGPIPRIRGLPALAAAVFALASCVGISADVEILADGSGTAAVSYRVSRLVEAMGRTGGEEHWLPLPTIHSDFEKLAAEIEGLSLASFSTKSDDTDLSVEAVLRFSDLGALSRFLDSSGRAASIAENGDKRELKLRVSEGGGPLDPDLKRLVDTVFRGYSVSLRFKFPSVPSVRGGSVDQAARTARYEAPVAEILSSEKAIDWIATW